MDVFSSQDLLGLILARIEDARSVLAFSQTCRAAARAVRAAAVPLRDRFAKFTATGMRFVCWDVDWQGNQLPNKAWWGLVQVAINNHRVGSARCDEYYVEQRFGLGGPVSDPETFEVNAWQYDQENSTLSEAVRKVLNRMCYLGLNHTGPYPIDHPDIVAFAKKIGTTLDPRGVPASFVGFEDLFAKIGLQFVK